MKSRWEQRYWSVDAPGLDAAGAAELVGHAGALAGVRGATAVDPDIWLTQHLDRETVTALVATLSVALESGVLDADTAWGMRQLVEDLQAWLDVTREEPAGD